MVDNVFNITDVSGVQNEISKSLENTSESELSLSISNDVNEIANVEVEEELNSCDILAKYIKTDLEVYTGTIVDPKDVQFMYDERCQRMSGYEDRMTSCGRKGSKTTLTPYIFLKIIELRELYNFPEMRVCAAIGISINNLRTWRQRGKFLPNDDKFDPYFTFFAWAWEKAGSYIEKQCLTNIKQAGETKWEASKWLLSKLHQDRYGDRMEVENGINNTQHKDVNLTVNLNLNDLKLVNSDLESFIANPIEIDNE